MYFVIPSCVPSDDYLPVDKNVTFKAGTVTKCVDISIANDELSEPEEVFTVVLGAVSDFVDIRDNTAIVTIADDDGDKQTQSGVRIGFGRSAYTVDEDEPILFVCIETFNGVPNTQFDVTLSTSDDTAIAEGTCTL